MNYGRSRGFNLRVSVIVAKEKGNNTKDIGGNMGNKKRLWSVFTDDMDHCFYTGKSPVERHHIFGASNRKHSEKYGYVIPLSPELHPNGVHANDNARQLDEILKKMAQAHFESHHGTRDDFRKIFGKSYL